jgi:hypothetical protein
MYSCSLLKFKFTLEIIRGSQYSQAGDIYSPGIILQELWSYCICVRLTMDICDGVYTIYTVRYHKLIQTLKKKIFNFPYSDGPLKLSFDFPYTYFALYFVLVKA